MLSLLLVVLIVAEKSSKKSIKKIEEGDEIDKIEEIKDDEKDDKKTKKDDKKTKKGKKKDDDTEININMDLDEGVIWKNIAEIKDDGSITGTSIDPNLLGLNTEDPTQLSMTISPEDLKPNKKYQLLILDENNKWKASEPIKKENISKLENKPPKFKKVEESKINESLKKKAMEEAQSVGVPLVDGQQPGLQQLGTNPVIGM